MFVRPGLNIFALLVYGRPVSGVEHESIKNRGRTLETPASNIATPPGTSPDDITERTINLDMRRFISSRLPAMAASFLCLIALTLSSSALKAQTPIATSDCFSMTLSTATHSCNSDACGGPPDPPTNPPCRDYNPPPSPPCVYAPCSTNCVKVTICNTCPSLTIDSIQIVTGDDNHENCRSYCPDSNCTNKGYPGNPAGDQGNTCSWQGPRTMIPITPLHYGDCMEFTICSANINRTPSKTVYTLSCIGSCATGGPPCGSAAFKW